MRIERGWARVKQAVVRISRQYSKNQASTSGKS